MPCIIETGGKQYLVKDGDILKVERIAAESGSEVKIPSLANLSLDTKVDAKHESCFATATILEHIRGEKDIVFKKKRRQGYKRKNGHRQNLSVIKITSIA